jgi:hypothetical protein
MFLFALFCYRKLHADLQPSAEIRMDAALLART